MKFTDKKTRIFSFLFIVLLVISTVVFIPNVKATQHNFGYETKGTSKSYFSGSYLRATKFTCSENGIANSITVYLEYDDVCDVKFAIYTDNVGVPNALVDYTDDWTVTSGWDNWKTLTLTLGASLTANTVYWLVLFHSASVNVYYIGGSTNQYAYKTQTYNGFPNPFGTAGGYVARKYSIYCTYTVSEEKTWNNAETWKLNLYTLKWFASELWKINLHNFNWFNVENWLIHLHNFSWFSIESWKINIYNFTWFISEVWNLHLYNYSWFNVENWKLVISTLVWNLAEIWKINIYTYNWFVSEVWKLSIYPFNWFNAETWLFSLHNYSWFTSEIWNIVLGYGNWYIAEIWSMINLIIPVVSINIALLYSILAIMIALVAVIFALSKREK